MRPLIEVPQCLFMLIDGLEENKREIASVAEGPDLFIFFLFLFDRLPTTLACVPHVVRRAHKTFLHKLRRKRRNAANRTNWLSQKKRKTNIPN